MISPEEQQIEICFLKFSLEEIENDLVGQCSALPALDSENEQRCRETMIALRVVRSLNSEMERLKLENVRLTAKSTQLKRQSDTLSKAVECARTNRCGLVQSLAQEEQDIEQQIRKYEDYLQEISDRFRKTRGYYIYNKLKQQTDECLSIENEEEMVAEISKVNNRVAELEGELGRRQSVVNELRQHFNEIEPEVPGDLLIIIGKNQLVKKVESLAETYEALKEKLNQLKCTK